MTDTATGSTALALDPFVTDPRVGLPCDDLDESMVCLAVAQETHDVKSFHLASPHRRRLRFHPGQYVTVTVSMDGHEIRRCYTIASSPVRPDELTITVKRVPGGPVSNWLHDNLVAGDTIPVTGPAGRFTSAEHPADRYLFLSAGSGITPLMSMTRTIDALAAPADVLFVHFARTPADIIFRDELRELAARNPRIRVVLVCEDDAPTEPWTGLRGRLTGPLLRSLASDLAGREVFTCGPPPYMEAARRSLAEGGAAATRCHEETFTFPGVLALDGAVDDRPPRVPAATDVHTVKFTRSGQSIECDADTPLLLAAARVGLTLPSSCVEGVCGTCKSTLLHGSVQMNHAGGIRPREIAQDKILLCCSTPCEDLVIDA